MSEVRKELLLTYRDLVKSPVIKKSLPCELAELFTTQKNADKAKKLLKGEFPEVVKLYFSKYMKSEEVDTTALLESLDKNEKVMRRHLGTQYELFKLIAILLKATEPKKKGLLAS